ncbi:Uncharacterised protein [Actinobacillus porcinus]|uniref:Uncharacterized protein n=1 Tax=Actinobacillus porcinus TaxID=51048 RepID=A0ABY6TL15_9PAST|nr:hypothetical protein [Actinobacillus porcinus]VFY93613.1 Uncharacterised protein [Actinobacillus porcinus]VTU08833.1 Uncharacterised protein [Actinobacillus porcinus]
MEVKVCVEVIFEDECDKDNLVINAKTDVLGGKIGRFNWEGNTFDEVEFYRDLLNGDQMVFLLDRDKGMEKTKSAIFLTLKDVIDEIKFDESLLEENDTFFEA